MRKILLFLPAMLLLAACAGNPPAWWNPSNNYAGTRKAQAQKASKPRVVRAAPVQEEPLIPTEESISVADENYEEMMLTPLQDEETEDTTGEASAQSVPETQDDNDLPFPSVLE